MDKKKVCLDINGKRYNVVGMESEDYLYRVGVYVDKKIKEISKVHPNISTTDAAVMAALTIADELLKIRDENEERDKRFQQLLHDNVSLINSEEVNSDSLKTGKQSETNNSLPGAPVSYAKRQDVFIPRKK